MLTAQPIIMERVARVSVLLLLLVHHARARLWSHCPPRLHPMARSTQMRMALELCCEEKGTVFGSRAVEDRVDRVGWLKEQYCVHRRSSRIH
eukprot:4430826-Amphidinium_carterae.2